MSKQPHGVIETVTGDLLRAGYCDFDIDPATETLMDEVPIPCYYRGQFYETQMSRWTGTEWILVDQP
jgi:hypothetical protein